MRWWRQWWQWHHTGYIYEMRKLGKVNRKRKDEKERWCLKGRQATLQAWAIPCLRLQEKKHTQLRERITRRESMSLVQSIEVVTVRTMLYMLKSILSKVASKSYPSIVRICHLGKSQYSHNYVLKDLFDWGTEILE